MFKVPTAPVVTAGACVGAGIAVAAVAPPEVSGVAVFGIFVEGVVPDVDVPQATNSTDSVPNRPKPNHLTLRRPDILSPLAQLRKSRLPW